MLKNFDGFFYGLDGIAIQENGQPVLLSKLVTNVLLATFPDEISLTGEDKLKRFDLASKVQKGGEQHYTPEEIVLIRQLAGKGLTTLGCARVWKATDDNV